MAAGPFARIIAQVVIVAGGALGRAVFQAYREAAARGAQNPNINRAMAIRRRMHSDEARNILDVQPIANSEEIIRRFERLHELNSPRDESPGSEYLQTKVTIAKDVLLDELATRDANETPQKETAKEDKTDL
eukprot:GEMP01070700.1.p1 GENE.GEMP01070700.1~~GEMP01070700.1.p1  ORF type:complete len:132 (+),score=28.03 GEMP01070700.1:23-418(+)